MNLCLLSLGYRTVPVELRERLALGEDHLPAVLAELRQTCGFSEAMVISTCNRVEFCFVAARPDRGFAALMTWLEERLGTEATASLDEAGIRFTHRSALAHLCRVACGLESMVLGEPQVFGQVKDAYRLAAEQGCAGPVLNGAMQRVFRVAKRVRTETGISRFAVSVSYAAVELGSRIFDTLSDKSVLVVGAGEMAELALAHLVKTGIGRLTLVNRTFANAVALAERFGGSAVRFEELAHQLGGADIVITSTGARGFIIDREMARQASRRRRGRPMFLIDIAVPRDIEPSVNELPNVYCYDIDDLEEAVDANRREREREALRAQELIEQELEQYQRWEESLALTPVIKALRGRFAELGERELAKALERMPELSDRAAEQMRRLVYALINKLLHEPLTRLRGLGGQPDGLFHAEALTALFDLHPASPEAEAVPPADDESPPEQEAPPDNVVPISRRGTPTP